MDHTDNVLDQLEQYLKFMKASGVQYLPLSDYSPSHDLPITDEGGRDGSTESESLSDFTPCSSLEDIRREFEDCARCDLSDLRNTFVFGSGNPNADLLFIGTAPNSDEDSEGEPFIGEDGDLLTKIIEAIKLRREDVYLSNLTKCCTPDGRNPTKEEASACKPILNKQIMTIRPLVICTLGDIAAQTLLDTEEPISSLRGRFHNYNGIPLMPTYHPSYILKNHDVKREVWEDMKQIKKMLDERT